MSLWLGALFWRSQLFDNFFFRWIYILASTTHKLLLYCVSYLLSFKMIYYIESESFGLLALYNIARSWLPETPDAQSKRTSLCSRCKISWAYSLSHFSKTFIAGSRASLISNNLSLEEILNHICLEHRLAKLLPMNELHQPTLHYTTTTTTNNNNNNLKNSLMHTRDKQQHLNPD